MVPRDSGRLNIQDRLMEPATEEQEFLLGKPARQLSATSQLKAPMLNWLASERAQPMFRPAKSPS
jgi:hypothetical protein